MIFFCKSLKFINSLVLFSKKYHIRAGNTSGFRIFNLFVISDRLQI
jgi:hypothetical protein